MSEYTGQELIQKIDNPIIFQSVMPGQNSKLSGEMHGYDVAILIDVCHLIIQADDDVRLKINQKPLAKQSRLILGSSAKALIQIL